jgi:hypothetical protein
MGIRSEDYPGICRNADFIEDFSHAISTSIANHLVRTLKRTQHDTSPLIRQIVGAVHNECENEEEEQFRRRVERVEIKAGNE